MALTQQDIVKIAALPAASQVAGGLNSFNQAAFGNIQTPTSSFSILPTVPTGIPNYQVASPPTQPGRQPGGGGGGGQGGGGRPGGGQGQNWINTFRQRLGLPPLPAGGAPGIQGGGDQARGQGMLTPQQRAAQALGLHGRGATQGGPGSGTAAAQEAIDKLVNSNIAVNPSVKQALKMASMFTGPTGLALGLANLAVGDPLGSILGSSGFNVPGSVLSPDALTAVRNAYADALVGIANPTPQQINAALAKAQATLDTERALANMGGVKAPGTPTPVGGYGSIATPQGPMISANFTSPGFSRAIGSAIAMGSPRDAGQAGGGPGGGGGGGGGFSGGPGPHGGLGSNPGAGVGGVGAGAANRSY